MRSLVTSTKCARPRADLEVLRANRLFVTGGTGFVGTWLLESLAWADRRLGLDLTVDVLTRDPDAAAARLPGVAAHDGFAFVRGDVRVPSAPARASRRGHPCRYAGERGAQ